MDLDLRPSETGLLIVDFQEKLAAAMPAEERARAEKNIGVLLAAAKEFKLPVIVTEQYPKGLGHTIPSIESAVRALPVPAVRAEKVEFNAACAPPVAAALGGLDRRAWIVTGMECHVCIYQTARELVRRGLTAHVVEDAVVSRRRENWEAGLRLMTAAGAVVTTTETVLFDLLGAAGTPAFKALSSLIR